MKLLISATQTARIWIFNTLISEADGFGRIYSARNLDGYLK